jgi:hypothetical protein
MYMAVRRAALCGSLELCFAWLPFMYLLYVDDAGSIKNRNERFFVLAGLAIFERQIFHLDIALEKLATEITPGNATLLEFHGNEMQSGRNRWRGLGSREKRRRHICEALQQGLALKGNWALFGVVIEKSVIDDSQIMEHAFAQLCSRFDMFLGRLHKKGDTQRGLIIMDESVRETELQQLARHFRDKGHQWGKLRNLVDVPFFVSSQATRLVQYADLVAYALWRAYEHDDGQFFEIIAAHFDNDGEKQHGLYVRARE